MKEEGGEDAEHDEPMFSLLDEDVLFKHFEKLHFVCAVEKEVGAVDHLSGRKLDSQNGHDEDPAPGELVRFVGDEENSMSTVDHNRDADPTLISLIRGSWSV